MFILCFLSKLRVDNTGIHISKPATNLYVVLVPDIQDHLTVGYLLQVIGKGGDGYLVSGTVIRVEHEYDRLVLQRILCDQR